MRGFWIALTLLVALTGGSASGYYANLLYGPRSSLYPLRVGTPTSFAVSVRRITYVAATSDKPEPRMSTPGIVDITPPAALAALNHPGGTAVTQISVSSRPDEDESHGSPVGEAKLGLR